MAVYSQNNEALSQDQIYNLEAGDTVNFGVTFEGTDYDVSQLAAEFRINNGTWQPAVARGTNTQGQEMFIFEYTIPEGRYNFKVEAKIYISSGVFIPTVTPSQTSIE